MKNLLARNIMFYITLTACAGLVDIVWNQFSLANYLHLPHVTFLATAGIFYIIYAFAAWIGYGFFAGEESQRTIENNYPYPH